MALHALQPKKPINVLKEALVERIIWIPTSKCVRFNNAGLWDGMKLCEVVRLRSPSRTIDALEKYYMFATLVQLGFPTEICLRQAIILSYMHIIIIIFFFFF